MRNSLSMSLPLLAAALLLAAVGCGGGNPTPKHDEAQRPQVPSAVAGAVAVARLAPTAGNDVSGTVTFTEQAHGVRVVAELTGLSEGQHGFHIHENGDCSAPDGSSAGGHFNPMGHDHAGPQAPATGRHVGDLGNIRAGADGNATYDRADPVLSFAGATSILGRSVIVHADEDDLETQPTGNAGGRVACGVIEKVEG